MVKMRAKMRLFHITPTHNDKDETVQELLHFHAVSASKYPEDGSDENNTYAKFSPSGLIQLMVANPALIGEYVIGTEHYIDFTPVE